MNAADAIRDFVIPLLPGWSVQFGRWTDTGKDKNFAVIKPIGGLPVELVRQPQFTLTLIGALNAAADVVKDAAEVVVTAMRSSAGALVFLQPSEPSYLPTADGRHVFELAVSAITN